MPKPFEVLDSEVTEEGTLQLLRRGDSDYMISVGGKVLMSSVHTSTELELAREPCLQLHAIGRPRVLIGGLGLGYTLRAALDALPHNASVTVAELNPVVIRWCREAAAEASGRAALDRRVQIVEGDVVQLLAQQASRGEPAYDAVIWDLYEGPTRRVPADHPLYGVQALEAVCSCLEVGGLFAVWGETQSTAFERRLTEVGFSLKSTESKGRGKRHALFLSTKRKPRRPRATPAEAQSKRRRR